MIYLDKKIKKPLYEQLYEILRNEIIQGKMKKDTVLYPIRVLASELQVSNNTVIRAYQQLQAEGYIRSTAGSGYYVENIEYLLKTDIPVRKEGDLEEKEKSKELELLYDFKYVSISADSFPWTKWKQYLQDAIWQESYQSTVTYESNKGNEELRKSLCEYLNSSRGINCRPEQIVICAGTQYALDIITNLLNLPEYRLGFEEPGYDGMRKLFLNKGYEIIPLPLMRCGINLKNLSEVSCNLLYLTPSHQFPTGITTSLSERLWLLGWAHTHHTYIIENDYDNEFSYNKKRLPSLRSLDKYDHVIYLSTLSKVLSPSLRCAYFILPDSLLSVYEDKYKYYYSALPTYHQTALANFINDGMLEKHARKMSSLNKAKYGIFSRTLKRLLPERVSIVGCPAGSHVLVQICGCTDQKAFIRRMAEHGIGIYGTKEYWYEKEDAPEDVFLFGYSSMSEEDIKTGCSAFADAVTDF